jgi:hypothetical protein
MSRVAFFIVSDKICSESRNEPYLGYAPEYHVSSYMCKSQAVSGGSATLDSFEGTEVLEGFAVGQSDRRCTNLCVLRSSLIRDHE